MDIPLSSTKVTAVVFPGTVINVQNMLNCFGGEKQITETFNDPSKRLELKFRPGDPYCKSSYGDRFSTTSLIMEVTRRTKKSLVGSKNAEPPEYKVKFSGVVEHIYKFKSLCDFQVLPVQYNGNGQGEPILDKLVPKGLPPSSWLNEEVPLFIPPIMFSRFDAPQGGYLDLQARVPRNPKESEPQSNTINCDRKKRPGYAIFVTFDTAEVATAPQQEAIDRVALYPMEIEFKKKLDLLFEERPIWTRNALLYKLNCERGRLRYALSSTAYYFTSGPWRTLWVKFGYDPRKNPDSKIYQIMDFRINSLIKNPGSVQLKKFSSVSYGLPAKLNAKNTARVPVINRDDLVTSKDDEEAEGGNASESDTEPPNYVLIPGRLPTTRQCYFQLCDIYFDDVQKLVHQNDGRERHCHERDGWCSPGILDKCREIIMQSIKETIELLDVEGM